jgi:5-methylcytosine-specific restriction endonuclease McrA
MPDKDPQRNRDRAAAWAKANPARSRANGRAWSSRNRDKMRQYLRDWRARHPDEAKADSDASHHARRGAPGVFSRTDARSARIASDGVCSYCLRADASHLDHCTPLSRGGENAPHNVTAACASCNLKKGAKTVLEFTGLWPAAS